MPWVPAGLIPNGTVCQSGFGEWGVIAGSRGRRRFDRWHGGKIELKLFECLYVPIEKLPPEPVAKRVRPMGTSIIPRVQDYVQNQTVLCQSGASSGSLQPESRPESLEE